MLVGYNFSETIAIALHYGFIIIVIYYTGQLLTRGDNSCTFDSSGALYDNTQKKILCYSVNDPTMPPVAWTSMGSAILCFVLYTTLIGNMLCEFFYVDSHRFDVFKEKVVPKFLPRNVRKVILYATKIVELLSLVTCDYVNNLANVNSNITLTIFALFNAIEICIELFANAYKQMKLKKEPSCSEFQCYPDFYTFLVYVLGFFCLLGFSYCPFCLYSNWSFSVSIYHMCY